MLLGGDSTTVVHPLFHEEGGGSIPTSPLQFFVGEIGVEQAARLNAYWHSRLPAVDPANIHRTTHKVCYAAEFDGIFYAVAIWTNPISRVLNGLGWLELRRFAIASNAPPNTASRLLKVMRIMAAKKFPDIVKLISYQDTSTHDGTIYRAAGWTPVENKMSGSNWDTPARRRRKPTADATAPKKIRWELDIRR